MPEGKLNIENFTENVQVLETAWDFIVKMNHLTMQNTDRDKWEPAVKAFIEDKLKRDVLLPEKLAYLAKTAEKLTRITSMSRIETKIENIINKEQTQ